MMGISDKFNFCGSTGHNTSVNIAMTPAIRKYFFNHVGCRAKAITATI
jgi:hypothetical protein